MARVMPVVVEDLPFFLFVNIFVQVKMSGERIGMLWFFMNRQSRFWFDSFKVCHVLGLSALSFCDLRRLTLIVTGLSMGNRFSGGS